MKGFLGTGILVTGIIIIVTIFAAIYYNPLNLLERRQDEVRVENLLKIREAVERYYLEYGEYPASSENNLIKSQKSQEINWGSEWKPYFDRLPKDPDSSRKYLYFSTGDSYRLYASLNHPEEFDNSCQGECKRLDDDQKCGSRSCNFGLSSPNTSF